MLQAAGSKILIGFIAVLILASGCLGGGEKNTPAEQEPLEKLPPSAPPSQNREPLLFSGSGDATLGPVDVVEGTLTFHIKTSTDCAACGFFLEIQQDSNLDGTFCGQEDGICTRVFSATYEEVRSLDTSVNFSGFFRGEHFFYGGRIKLLVDADNIDWEIKVEQHPSPRHTIQVAVFDAKDNRAIENAEVVLVDSENNRYKPAGFDLPYYYFDRSFFGYRNYTVKVSAPGYAPQTKTITLEDWKSLSFPGALYVEFYL